MAIKWTSRTFFVVSIFMGYVILVLICQRHNQRSFDCLAQTEFGAKTKRDFYCSVGEDSWLKTLGYAMVHTELHKYLPKYDVCLTNDHITIRRFSTITMNNQRRKKKNVVHYWIGSKKFRQNTTINCICQIDIEHKNSEIDHKMNHNKMNVDLISH